MYKTPPSRVRLYLLIFILFSVSSYGQTLTRGPYLQMGNQTEITLRWRTNVASDSRVEVGMALGTYPKVTTINTPVTEHIVRVTGLNPDTKYFYRIGTTTTILQGAPDNFFTTVPPPDTKRKVRVALFGDCGRSDDVYQDENLSNYISYLSTNGIDAPDAWLLLGDNAYSQGTDAQYTTKFFGIYGDNILKNHKLYPAPGNHDYGNDETLKPSRAIPYYNIFSTPEAGECGGVPSNKPNYYSFDIGNIHFLSLDSWGVESDLTEMGTAGTSAIKTWVINDLAANTKKWVIAYWHHPPYTKGSHNSDSESELVDIRQNFIEELESRGVDMIVCGHSHNYERSYLMKDFRGNWSTFNLATNAVSSSSAKYTSSSTCPYVYNTSPSDHGTVYVVAGSSGASGTPKSGFGSGAFPWSVEDGGVFYLEVEDNRLDARMLRRDGSVFDQFTIMKDVNISRTMNILKGTSVTLSASWPATGDYTWDNAATSRSITVNPPPGTTNYSVTDDYGCVTDNFTVNALAVLPVQLTTFKVYLNDEKVNVDWTTSSETNSWYYKVERSIDASNFETISTVNAAGNSTVIKNYSITDGRPLKGTSYYRLAQIDQDRHVKYSDIKRIVNSKGKNFDIKLNVSGEVLNISFQSTTSDKVSLKVYDLSGRTILTQNWTINRGLTQGQVILPKGVNILKFITANNETVIQKIMIE
jgi:hypothetical protein